MIPDDQLNTAVSLAADLDFHPASSLRPKYTPEYSNDAIRYIIDERKYRGSMNINPAQRLILLPFSWAAISLSDIVRVPDEANNLGLYTVPFVTTCTALVRIICREMCGSSLRFSAIQELCSLLTFRYFDMSYEGDWMEFPANDEPFTDKEQEELNNAVAQIENWDLHQDDIWIKESLVRILKGEMTYHQLPYDNEIPK